MLGQHGEKPLTGPLGRAVLFREVLRHEDPERSVVFEGPRGHVALMPGFADTPTLSLEQKYLDELEALFTPGQPAIEIGNIEMLDAMGVLEEFKQLVRLAKEERQHKEPGTRFKRPAIVKLEKLSPGELVYDAIFTIRAHMGIDAVRRDFEQWLNDNSNLFPKIDTLITAQNWQDPRPILSDLAVLRLVRLHGYSGARDWTREHRPHKRIRALEDSDYEKYYVEKKLKARQPRPLYERQREYENAVGRALVNIASVRKL